MDVSISSITFDVIEIDDYLSSSPREQIGCFVFSTIACATNINVSFNKGQVGYIPILCLLILVLLTCEYFWIIN
jgi:hypothetical protein